MTNIEKWLIENGFKEKKCPSFLEASGMNEYRNKYGSSVFVYNKEKIFHVYEGMWEDLICYGGKPLKRAIDDIPDKWEEHVDSSLLKPETQYVKAADDHMDEADEFFRELLSMIFKTAKPDPIKAIYPNKEKRVCAVKFHDGSISVLKLAKGDKWDLHTAIAYAIAQKAFGGRDEFSEYTNKLIADAKKRENAKKNVKEKEDSKDVR